MNKSIDILVGTRPNFIKITQFRKVSKELGNFNIRIIHTGQHFDARMADVFFQQLDVIPDIFLNVKPNSPNKLIADIMVRLEDTLNEECPDLLIVVGDVNSTMAGAITANKLNIPLAHLESGLRSFDRTMPEEFNRIVTDDLADYHFVTEQSGIDNLIKEGKLSDGIFFVGNTMIDTLVAFESQIQGSDILNRLDLISEDFVLMTMHRPATVDNKMELIKLFSLLEIISIKYKTVFPIHPRTKNKCNEFGMTEKMQTNNNLILTEPLSYFDFQKLIAECKFILTDSGGIQEEATFRKKPCLTLRPNTERPSTINVGSNTLLPFDLEVVHDYIFSIENGSYKRGEIPELWDGNATQRILERIKSL